MNHIFRDTPLSWCSHAKQKAAWEAAKLGEEECPRLREMVSEIAS